MFLVTTSSPSPSSHGASRCRSLRVEVFAISLVAVRGSAHQVRHSLSSVLVSTQHSKKHEGNSNIPTFDIKMKSAYVICVLLGVTIGTLVLADNIGKLVSILS